jgi:Berberine and berberine like
VPSSSGGASYERLVTAKGRYYLDNIFRLNHNIDPVA